MLSGLGIHAEGSRDLYPNGVSGGRAFLMSTLAKSSGWRYTNKGIQYVYVKAGETVTFASSAQGIGLGKIVVHAPDGTSDSTNAGDQSVGFIANRTQELAGPDMGGVTTGYIPFTKVATAAQEGIWQVEFIATGTLFTNATSSAHLNVLADAAWTQDNNTSPIAAWDISVYDAASNYIKGRVYANVLNMYVTHNDYRGKLYVLTVDGYLYHINNNGSNGLGFVAFVSNKGIGTSANDNAVPAYKSLNSQDNLPIWDPNQPDGTSTITHKMFYNVPDASMPNTAKKTYLDQSDIASFYTDWLFPVKTPPTVSDVSIYGVEGTSDQVSAKGGYIQFTSNIIGNYRVTLSGSGSFVTRKMAGTAVKGVNRIFWDGKDGAGSSPSLGTVNLKADIQLQGAEIHFPFIDVEDNPHGLIVEQLNDDNTTVASDIIYWDDSNVPSQGANVPSNPNVNGNDGAGISSNTNGHIWDKSYGDGHTMDTWTYVLGSVLTKNTSLSVITANLKTVSVGPKDGSTTQILVGKPITYETVVTNLGPSDVTNATYEIKIPGNFTFDPSTVVVTGGCAVLHDGGLDVSGNYIAKLDIPNGCVATIDITGTPTAAGALNSEASIMRPADVTDPDATNPDPTATPTDPHLECKNGGPAETCNNIQYNTTVTAVPSTDVSITKTTSATSFTPGGDVIYTIKVKNIGTSDANDVEVTDNAPVNPAGAAITSWTAVATTGIVTVPSPSGSGDLDQTISLLPVNAEVTYTVNVHIPNSVTGTPLLSNTASVSTSTSDVNTSNNTATTPGIPMASADLSITETPSTGQYQPGTSTTYTVTVTNNGPATASNVHITDLIDDLLPAGSAIISWTATGSGVTVPSGAFSGAIDQTYASLPSGASITYNVTIKTPSNGTVNEVNKASVTSDTYDPDITNNTASSSLTPDIIADVVINKTPKTTSQTQYVPGNPIEYLITVKNNGPSDAQNVNVLDNAPTGTFLSSWTATADNSFIPAATSGTGNLNQTISSLPNGVTVTYDVILTTSSNATDNVTNTASFTATTNNGTGNPANGNSTATTLTPAPQPDVKITKQLSLPAPTEFVPGDIVKYDIIVTNQGPSDATNVHVTDVAPAGTTITGWTCVINGGADVPVFAGSGDLDQIITSLPLNATVTYHISVQTPAAQTTSLVNTATADATGDPNTANNSKTTDPLPAAPVADVAISNVVKTGAATYTPGGVVVYTITVTNNGPSDAQQVEVTNLAPTGTNITSWTATGTDVTAPNASGNGNLDEMIPTLPTGASVVYTVVLTIPASYTGSLNNTANVNSITPDNNTANNTSTAGPLTPQTSADLSMVKTLHNPSQASFVSGDAVTYDIVIINHGPSDAQNVRIQDVAPVGTTITGWTNTAIGVTLSNTSGTGNLDETIPTLPNGAKVTYLITVQTPASYTGTLVNSATLTSSTIDPTPADNSSTAASVPAVPVADLSMNKKLKDATQTSFKPGESIDYVINITNNGPSDAQHVNVVDNAPAGTTISKWTASVTNGTVTLPHSSGAGNLNETIATLPNNATVTYTVTVQTPAAFTGSFVNTASVSSPTTDPTPASNSSTAASVAAAPEADIAVTNNTQNPAQTTFVPGSSVVYIVTVTNNGPSDAHTVTVTNAAPAGTTISNWTAMVTDGNVSLPASSGTGDLNQAIANLPRGASITYTVTVQTPAGMTGNLISTASANAATPDNNTANNAATTPPLNNTPSADLVTVKMLKNSTQTQFVPGDEVPYVITITNNGPADAINVNVTDAAPANTTINSWAATVVTGNITLPNVSGTGNLNETIATFPNGAVVRYEVILKTDASYTGSLVNVAAVTSITPDPDPTCTGCTAPAITTELPPVAATDNAGNIQQGINNGNGAIIPVLANDQPGSASTPIDTTSVAIVDQPAHGSVTVNNDGTVTYVPEAGYTGQDSFSYNVKDKNGNVSNTATVTLTVIPADVEVPNVITPNGDGENDKLVIKGLEKFTQTVLIIFNRWNNILYKQANYSGQWDGQGLNAGTYFYTLKGLDTNGQWHTYNGYIMLLK